MCLDDQLLSTYLDGELTEPWKSQVEEHLSYCQACQARLKSLEKLDSKIQSAALSDEEIKNCQDRVLSYLEKNCLNEKKSKLTLLQKKMTITFAQAIGTAAAVVVIFAGSIFAIGNRGNDVIDAPTQGAVVDISEITPVKGTESSKKGLESYSVEEILNYLDNKGYDVVLSIKGIQPIEQNGN